MKRFTARSYQQLLRSLTLHQLPRHVAGQKGSAVLSQLSPTIAGSAATFTTKATDKESSMPSAQERHQLYMKTYESTNVQEIQTAYKNWAPVYEMHIQDQGWQAPELCADLLVSHFQKDGTNKTETAILDIGAGTGLVGKALKELDYTQVDALDVSSDMLEQAATKDAYRSIVVDDASDMQTVASDAYDGAICVGALNFGHIPAQALREFVRIVKPGGLIAFTTRQDFYKADCKDVQDAMVMEGIWQLVEERQVGEAVKDMPHIHFCYRKC